MKNMKACALSFAETDGVLSSWQNRIPRFALPTTGWKAKRCRQRSGCATVCHCFRHHRSAAAGASAGTVSSAAPCLIWVKHNIITDAWSEQLIANDLWQRYNELDDHQWV
ncbi:hypothetical protein M8494_20205 [Serratia ureilytica]